MPVNFQQVQEQVREFGRNIPQRQKKLGTMCDETLAELRRRAGQLEALQARVNLARQSNPQLRCALPAGENLDTARPAPEMPVQAALLAADGSQIFPDRHASVEYSLVNVGALQMVPGQPPIESIQSQLLTDDQLYTQNGMITEEMVSLMRDLEERRVLMRLASQIDGPVVTLTDGQLELFREPKETQEFKEKFDAYLAVLRQLSARAAVTAGYVERPRGDLVVRLLELMRKAPDDLARADSKREMAGVRDIDLFRKILTEPGQRSAIFAIQSASAEKFSGELALHFFYLNVGRAGKPILARVEMPAWVARSPKLLDSLHAVLVSQCRVMGSRPYPYILHRAHEVAVVTLVDKQNLVDMITAEIARNGGTIPEETNKQAAKDLPGRTRLKI